ncbi:ferredoxin reductase [Pseudoxanthomonas gei]|uniref:Ferredoxin reductase n=1 Tax=Pseudoxanthomonas gei TaxID=1383030 RepID=A0ABX0A823_9GAMM|nr:ferredoxin reductase [Pseudoxanthomonas gei]NDK37679.1 ferredoxin reductase [Pseudoxanthomonas gei]
MNALVRTPAAPPRNRLKRVLQPLVSPQVFDFWASQVNPAWSWERPLGRIVRRHAETADSVTLWIRPNRHWNGARPGQHLNISAQIDGVRVTRSYSLTSAYPVQGCVSITIKGIEGGRLSQYLHKRARVGDVLDLGQAFGDMILPATPVGSWLFLAAGSGITPLMAMVRAMEQQGMPVPLTLVYWARTRGEFCFADELRALAARHANFNVRFALTREDGIADDETTGRISELHLDELVDNLESRQVFACGPGGFVDSARSLLESRTQSFQAEAFTPLPQVVQEGGEVQVTLAASGRTLTLPRGTSLLKALEAEGLRPPSGCRMGICNTCACGKSAGATRNLNTGELAGEPVSALKLCINSAVTDLVLDL